MTFPWGCPRGPASGHPGMCFLMPSQRWGGRTPGPCWPFLSPRPNGRRSCWWLLGRVSVPLSGFRRGGQQGATSGLCFRRDGAGRRAHRAGRTTAVRRPRTSRGPGHRERERGGVQRAESRPSRRRMRSAAGPIALARGRPAHDLRHPPPGGATYRVGMPARPDTGLARRSITAETGLAVPGGIVGRHGAVRYAESRHRDLQAPGRRVSAIPGGPWPRP